MLQCILFNNAINYYIEIDVRGNNNVTEEDVKKQGNCYVQVSNFERKTYHVAVSGKDEWIPLK